MTDPTRESIDAAITKWTPAALEVEPTVLTLPVRVLAGEAIDLAFFAEHYWEPQVIERRPIPGLKQAVGRGGLRATLPQELRELQYAMTDYYSNYLMQVSPRNEAPSERGETIANELRQALAFASDDDVSDEFDEQLRRIDDVHANPTSHDGLALALEAYSRLAAQHIDRIRDLPEFEESIVDEALIVAKRLREQSGIKLTNDAADQSRTAIEHRNRFATLLIERIRIVRRAAHYVFRNHPEIARKASSAYERTRRARRRTTTETPAAEVAATAE